VTGKLNELTRLGRWELIKPQNQTEVLATEWIVLNDRGDELPAPLNHGRILISPFGRGSEDRGTR
jgi:hypothetical protein